MVCPSRDTSRGWLRFGAPDRAGHGAPLWLFAMDMADEAVLSYEHFVGRRSVGGIRPYAARRIGFVEKSLT